MTDAKDRQGQAVRLHLAGASYSAIAEALGYASKSGAYAAVQEGMGDLGRPDVTREVVSTEIARLDAMLIGLWGKATKGDVQAVDRVLKISERRDALLALSGVGGRAKEQTPLDEFTRRLAERQSTPPPPHRAEGSA